MPAKIFCKVGPLKGLSAEIAEEATFGRSRSSTIRLQADLVSGEHFRIRYGSDEGCYLLEDLGSTNGTALDGIRVRGKERLGHLHVITLAGDYDLVFQDLERCARRHETAAPDVGRRPSEDIEDTAIEDDVPVPPPVVQAAPIDIPAVPKDIPAVPKDAPAVPKDAPAAPEGTQVEVDLPVLPAAIAGLAPAAAPFDETNPPDMHERTGIQETPVELPSFLARKADEMRDAPAAPEKDEEKPTVELSGPVDGGPMDEAETPPARGAAVSEERLEQLLLGDDDESGESQAYALAVAWPDSDIQYLPLREGENVVGRGEAADVRIESPDVSRRHAVVTVTGTEVSVHDVGSSNKTFVEGVQLEKSVPAQLRHGARLKFGGVRARLMHWVGKKEQTSAED